jgi:hypothetical protein
MLGEYGQECIKGWGQEETPAVLLAMISVISQQVNAAEAQNLLQWAFVPHPPLLHGVTWKSPSISVFTNDSELVGGHSSEHLVPTFTNYNFTFTHMSGEFALLSPSHAYLEKCSIMEWYSVS